MSLAVCIKTIEDLDRAVEMVDAHDMAESLRLDRASLKQVKAHPGFAKYLPHAADLGISSRRIYLPGSQRGEPLKGSEARIAVTGGKLYLELLVIGGWTLSTFFFRDLSAKEGGPRWFGSEDFDFWHHHDWVIVEEGPYDDIVRMLKRDFNRFTHPSFMQEMKKHQACNCLFCVSKRV